MQDLSLTFQSWQWHKTRLRQPDRAERHWLAQSLRLRSSSDDDWGSFASRAVAMLWMLTLGGEEEIADDEPIISARLPPSQAACAYSFLVLLMVC